MTGATGWIGSATVDELLDAGHDVIGLARSDASAAALDEKGVKVLRGDLDDLDSLRSGAAETDGVVHLANKHDWADPAETKRSERAAIGALADALLGTDRPLVVAAPLSGIVEGRPVRETDASPAVGPDSARGGSENLALEYAGRGVRTVIARFAPSVHGVGDWGFVSFLAAAARKHGVSAYVGDGTARWSAVARADAARLIRLGLEQAPARSRLHVVDEEAISTRTIAEALGRALDLPVTSVAPGDADEHFGFVGGFFRTTMTASNELTRAMLPWTPTGAGLVEDIDAGAYGRA
ncbi:NAD-dependent epimerase/dehydratase family protein [Luteipulveratus mongoliensis]|uniref:NAD-dependent epimerase/dehydratase family protein n=1 Tax=Luteipulveratus mongoliensis TaxID=571913 RepID=UPI001FDFAF1A|nr:NAD-dependent epimerase/dehydratase family protein [Luteipulveratus mongoliensis]